MLALLHDLCSIVRVWCINSASLLFADSITGLSGASHVSSDGGAESQPMQAAHAECRQLTGFSAAMLCSLTMTSFAHLASAGCSR